MTAVCQVVVSRSLFRYIVFNVPVHLYVTLSTVNLWFTKSLVLSQIYVYLLYPMSAVSFCASIYMTLAVTIERYIAVCRYAVSK